MLRLILLSLLLLTEPASADTQVRRIEGAGSHTSRPFRVDGPWELKWSSQSIMSIALRDVNGTHVGHYMSTMSGGTGSAYQPKGGVFYLEATGAGSWTLEVIAINGNTP